MGREGSRMGIRVHGVLGIHWCPCVTDPWVCVCVRGRQEAAGPAQWR